MKYKELITKTQKKPVLPIIYYPENEDELRIPSIDVPIDQITTPQFQKFLDKLDAAMMNEPLMPGWMPGGISAVQTNIPLKVFITFNSNTEQYQTFINPKLDLLGSAADVKEEGCLSFPDTTVPVRRSKRCRITYYDTNGNLKREKYSGWNARVIQHEYDHLLGILFIDKIA